MPVAYQITAPGQLRFAQKCGQSITVEAVEKIVKAPGAKFMEAGKSRENLTVFDASP
jgi:hypothetical protein